MEATTANAFPARSATQAISSVDSYTPSRITSSLITNMRRDQGINMVTVRFGPQRLEARMHQNHWRMMVGNGLFNDAIMASAVGIGLTEG